jgi:endonuclease/exonuclease/phosphatase family metal-dependent hydrolase
VWTFAFSLLLLARLAGAQPFTVASLNLAMTEDPELILKELRAKPAVGDADVLFLQEVVLEDGTAVAERIARDLGRYVVSASPDGKNSKGALAVVSRYPLEDQRTYKLKPQNLIFRSRSRIALAVTVTTQFGRVRLINAHLDTRINPAERIAQLQAALDSMDLP